MRQDKLTTKLQEALADAQSLAVGNDNQYIEPVHLLSALLSQSDGGARSLLQRAGVNVGGLQTALRSAFDRLPKVSGTGGDVQVGRELVSLLNLADDPDVINPLRFLREREIIHFQRFGETLELVRGEQARKKYY